MDQFSSPERPQAKPGRRIDWRTSLLSLLVVISAVVFTIWLSTGTTLAGTTTSDQTHNPPPNQTPGPGQPPYPSPSSGTPVPCQTNATAVPTTAATATAAATATVAATATTSATVAPLDTASVAGQVSAINGSTLTVGQPGQSTDTTVQLASNVVVQYDETITFTDIVVGDTVAAAGTRNGSEFTANRIRVTTGSSTPSGGSSGSDQSSDGPLGTPLAGTVTAVTSDSITVTDADGSSVHVTLAANGKIRKPVEGDASDIAVGNSILAFGATENGVFTATRVIIVPDPT